MSTFKLEHIIRRPTCLSIDAINLEILPEDFLIRKSGYFFFCRSYEFVENLDSFVSHIRIGIRF